MKKGRCLNCGFPLVMVEEPEYIEFPGELDEVRVLGDDEAIQGLSDRIKNLEKKVGMLSRDVYILRCNQRIESVLK